MGTFRAKSSGHSLSKRDKFAFPAAIREIIIRFIGFNPQFDFALISKFLFICYNFDVCLLYTSRCV